MMGNTVQRIKRVKGEAFSVYMVNVLLFPGLDDGSAGGSEAPRFGEALAESD